MPVSVLVDTSVDPYWSPQCEENQAQWWLPLLGAGQNYKVDQTVFWKKSIVPELAMVPTLSISLPPEIKTTESSTVKGTRKIRVWPKNIDFMVEMLRQTRRAYNLAIACFQQADVHPELRRDPDFKKTELRRTIREFVRDEVSEREGAFRSSSVDEAVCEAFLAQKAIISKRKKGLPCGYSFRRRKSPKKSFVVQRLSPRFVQENFHVSEELPKEAFGKLTMVTLDRGRWFINAQKSIGTVGTSAIQAASIVALDPGVRTFITSYSSDSCTSYGDQFFYNKVYPILLQLDRLYSQRSRCNNDQWRAHYQKKIDRLSHRRDDLISDLHKRVAHDLVMRYDVILLPKFETQDMTSRTKRKLRTKTVRSMLGLKHYQFQVYLQWVCKKYGKTLIIVNEAYTSKTRSWDGHVVPNLGSSKTITDGNIVVDRDINGARGILLRALYGNLHRKQARVQDPSKPLRF